jgi:SAM-dependent methyltransferase
LPFLGPSVHFLKTSYIMRQLDVRLLVLMMAMAVKAEAFPGCFMPTCKKCPCVQSSTLQRFSAHTTSTGDTDNMPVMTPTKDAKRSELVQEFVSKVQESILEKSFVALTLRGVKKKKKGDDATALRGSIRQVQGRLIQVKKHAEEAQLQLTLKYHGATDICKNLGIDELSEKLPELILDPLASEWGVDAVQAKPIQGAELTTLTDVLDLQLNNNKPALVKRKATVPQEATAPNSHDRTKEVPLSNQADFLQALGVTKADGKPRPGMKSKLRQCQKFVEIVGGLVQKIKDTDTERPMTVVDMGCGRGYLTFALHAYLSEHYDSVSSQGIDVRPKLVEEISGIARSLGGAFDTLSFEEGTIEDVVASGTSSGDDKDDSLDILIALHACDTATDDALWSGIARAADLIVVAPCCHKQVRPQLNAHFSAESQTHPLADILKHGVYRERISETVTDSLRALLLERAGYKVQVFEFIGGEHTSKNVMITAAKSRPVKNVQGIQEKIRALAAFHGVHRQKLAEWMEEDLGGSDQVNKSPRMSMNQMPPL